jgi:hypothetical protein
VGDDGEVKELNLEGVMDNDSESDTEDDDVIAVGPPPKAKQQSKAIKRSASEAASARRSESGSPSPRLIEFEKKLADPTLSVEKVFDEMGEEITSKIVSSFGSNGYSQANQMMKAMRQSAIEYEEAKRFNAFLRRFKDLLLDESSPRPRIDYWDRYMRGIESLSLITDKEAVEDDVDVTKKESTDFINL